MLAAQANVGGTTTILKMTLLTMIILCTLYTVALLVTDFTYK